MSVKKLLESVLYELRADCFILSNNVRDELIMDYPRAGRYIDIYPLDNLSHSLAGDETISLKADILA